MKWEEMKVGVRNEISKEVERRVALSSHQIDSELMRVKNRVRDTINAVPAPVKILWGYLQWYDISSELIPSEFWGFIILPCVSEQLIFNRLLNSKRFLDLDLNLLK
jgi:hypothetical protein